MITLASSSDQPCPHHTQASPKTLVEAVTEYLHLRLAEGLDPSGDTISHLRLHLVVRLCGPLGSIPVDLIRPEHLRTWAASLMNPKNGHPMSITTIRHHLIDVKTFFKRAHLERWIDHDPSRVVALPQAEDDDVCVMPVKDAFHFFKRNRDARAVARVALEAFGGVRYTTAALLTKENIFFEERGIEMPANKHKSKKRKYRQGMPACLWNWLESAPDSCWTLTKRQYAEEKKEMLVLAGLRPMVLKDDEDRAIVRRLKNVWRHSFGSYMLAQTKSFETVGYLMQHSRPSTTEIYEGVARERDAALYLSITPATVEMEWEDFARVFSPKSQHQISQ